MSEDSEHNGQELNITIRYDFPVKSDLIDTIYNEKKADIIRDDTAVSMEKLGISSEDFERGVVDMNLIEDQNSPVRDFLKRWESIIREEYSNNEDNDD